jgi:cell division septation protein DedD
MKYQIENTLSAVILGIFEADSEAEALEMMAKECGYRSYVEACEIADGKDIIVTEAEQ